MSESDVTAPKPSGDRRVEVGDGQPPFHDRRKAPRPPLAEIRRGGTLNLLPPVVVSGAVRTAEFLLISLLGLGIYLGYVDYENDRVHLFYLGALFVAALGYMSIAHMLGLYQVSSFNRFALGFTRVFIAWTIVIAGLMSIAFFVKISADFSRVWIATWYASGLGVLFVERLFLSFLARKWLKEGRLYRRAVIVGGGPEAEELIKALEVSADADIRIVGIFDDRGFDRVGPIVAGYPKLGNINELVEYARSSRLDLVIITLPITAEQRLLYLLKKLQVLPVDIRLSVHGSPLRFRPRTYSYIGNVPFIDLTDKAIANWDVVKKWLFDKIVAAIAVVLLAPLMALIAIAVKLDSRGPALFRQKRMGFNNEVIDVLKYRTMYVEAESQSGAAQVIRDDPRVTRVGRILRRTSLDELPQFFNVLKGDLSLVGPRPHALESKAADKLYHDAVDGYFARHRVKPGVTGWAQINGWRGETDTAEKIERRVEHDLYYIENWSVTFDLYILLMTPLALIRGENAF